MKDISYNFGAIKDTVSRLSSSEIIRENESKTLNRFVNEVKNNPVFYKQNILYKNIKECKPFEKERLAERFIAQNLKMVSDLKWNDILNENKRIRRELLDDMHVEAQVDNDLFECINTLLESQTNPNFTDFYKEQEAYEKIVSHLTREVVEESEKSEEKEDNPDLFKNSWRFITQNAVSNFNERYDHLNESEKEVFKILVSEGNIKKAYLENLKEETKKEIDRVLREGNEEEVYFVKGFSDKIEKINTEDYSRIDESILACVELKQHLEDL
jgi:hypothetical protein